MAPPPRITFPVTLAASTWETVVQQAQDAASRRRGYVATDVARVPKLSNSEALQLIRAMTLAIGRPQFPLWYQFAAVAYGWDPTSDQLDTTSAHGDQLYPPDASVELWQAVKDAGAAADSSASHPVPSLYFDDVWADPLYAADVRRALQEDGADAAFKIPLPACKDPKTGKPTGRPSKGPDGKWRCDPVAVDDPVTFAGKQFGTILVLALGAWLLFGKKPRRSRRS